MFCVIKLNLTLGSDVVGNCTDVRCVVNCNQAQNIPGLYRDLVIISFLSTRFQVVNVHIPNIEILVWTFSMISWRPRNMLCRIMSSSIFRKNLLDRKNGESLRQLLNMEYKYLHIKPGVKLTFLSNS